MTRWRDMEYEEKTSAVITTVIVGAMALAALYFLVHIVIWIAR